MSSVIHRMKFLDLMIALVECFNYLQPAIKKERIKLLYDSSIESRQFIANQNLLASINNLPKDEPEYKKIMVSVYEKSRRCFTESSSDNCQFSTLP